MMAAIIFGAGTGVYSKNALLASQYSTCNTFEITVSIISQIPRFQLLGRENPFNPIIGSYLSKTRPAKVAKFHNTPSACCGDKNFESLTGLLA
jgi:hypothetical protein